MFVEYLMAILDFANLLMSISGHMCNVVKYLLLMSISGHMCNVVKYLMSDTFQWSK